MPKIANGIDLQWNLRRARSENYEFEFRPKIREKIQHRVRLLGYENHANMGSYRRAVARFLAGKTRVRTSQPTRCKPPSNTDSESISSSG